MNDDIQPGDHNEQPETTNDFLFGSDGRTVSSLLPVIITSRAQAYRTAAWLKTMATVFPDDDGGSFDDIEEAIRST